MLQKANVKRTAKTKGCLFIGGPPTACGALAVGTESDCLSVGARASVPCCSDAWSKELIAVCVGGRGFATPFGPMKLGSAGRKTAILTRHRFSAEENSTRCGGLS